MKFTKLLAALVILAASISSPVYAQNKFVVDNIKIEGLQRVALGAALTYMPVKVGDQMNGFRIAQVIRSLHSSGHFERIRVLRDGDTLVVQVTERPTISNIIFEGNDDIKDEQLQDSLLNNNIRIGEPLDRTVLTNIESGLKDFYYSVGKYDAEVSAIVTPLPRNRVDLKFLFEEGDPAKITQINIVGNEVFSDVELLDGFELDFDAAWWDILAETRYQKQTLEGDMETLRSYYMDRGYLKFNVDSTQVSMTPDKTGIYIAINVTEGEQYTISGVELTGDLLGNEETMEKILPLTPGKLYNQAQVTYAEEFISKYLGRFGYAYPTVTTIPEINEDEKTVQLTLNVDPGRRIYVRRINFRGHDITSDEVLRREVSQMEGSFLSNQALESSKANISRRLNFVEEVEFETIRLPGEDDQVDVEFTVKEQPSGSFNAGVGFGDRTGLSLQAGIQQDNFLGSGKSVGFNLNTNRFQKSAVLSYNDPYFTIDGISLGGSVSYSEFDGSDFNIIEYNTKTWSVGATLGFPIDQFNRIRFGASYRSEELAQRDTYIQTARFYDLFVDPDNPTAPISYDTYQLSAAWIRSTLNRGLFPTAGSNQTVSISATTPNSDANYYKAEMNTRFYFPISTDQRWTVLTRLRLGYGNGYSEINGRDQLLPFTQNFTAGGSGTLRGFENNTVGPRAVQRFPRFITGPDGSDIALGAASDQLGVTQRSIGGNAMVLGGVELIVPTPFIGEEYDTQVRTSIFLDVGNVWDTEFDLDDFRDLQDSEFNKLLDFSDPGLYRASYGLSVQWLAPVGPMAFSFSRAITERSGDEVKFFSFNIGQTF
ncbi:MAG: outer membrane protein assembly factor BamA [Aestuariibacter sp.]